MHGARGNACLDARESRNKSRFDLVRTLPKADSGTVEGHLQGCGDCRAVLENAYKLLASH